MASRLSYTQTQAAGVSCSAASARQFASSYSRPCKTPDRWRRSRNAKVNRWHTPHVTEKHLVIELGKSQDFSCEGWRQRRRPRDSKVQSWGNCHRVKQKSRFHLRGLATTTPTPQCQSSLASYLSWDKGAPCRRVKQKSRFHLRGLATTTPTPQCQSSIAPPVLGNHPRN